MEEQFNLNAEDRYWGMEEKTFLLLLHLSQFAGFIVPYAGLILPIVMWATNKEYNENINAHGKVILNWLISATIYAIICFFLIFVGVGIFLLVALAVVAIIFPILGALKANNGEIWQYPMSINFIK